MGLSSLKIRWISTDFCRPAKCRPCFLGGKVGTVMHSSCFTQKLLIPISAAKQHGRHFALQRSIEILPLAVIMS